MLVHDWMLFPRVEKLSLMGHELVWPEKLKHVNSTLGLDCDMFSQVPVSCIAVIGWLVFPANDRDKEIASNWNNRTIEKNAACIT